MKNLLTRTLKAGSFVGTLDILAALLHYYIKTGKDPLFVLTYISSGVFGKEAFTRGNSTMFWGLFFHYLVACSFTFFFFLVFPKIQGLMKNNILIGCMYGIFMWAVMQYLVLPLSAAPKSTPTIANAITAILILVICIGIPLSLIAGRDYQRRNNKK